MPRPTDHATSSNAVVDTVHRHHASPPSLRSGLRAMADLKRKHICSHDGCDYSTTHMSAFKRHKNAVHDGLRPFACDYIGCSYKAGELGKLKRHKNSHEGLHPFACDHIGCAYKAGELQQLNRHKRTHVRPHLCDRPGCDEAFSSPLRLAVHVRMHSAVATTGCEKRPIPGVPGYTASSQGHVFNAAGNTMAQTIVAGYAKVGIMVYRVGKVVFVHRLVALAFHGLPPDKSYTVDHIDRIKTNNNASNLRWATKAEQRANRTQPDKCPSNWRPVVITSAAGQVSEFRSVAEAVESLGLPKDSSARELERALRGGGTWRYNDTAREGVTYRPIPSSAIGGKEGYNAGDDGSVLEPCGRVTFGSYDSYGYRLWGHHRVHRLVAAAFLPFDATRVVVNHRNGVKYDNQLSNLEYVTPSENILHAHATGLAKGRPVIGTQASGAETRFPSIAEAARAVGVKGRRTLWCHMERTTLYRGYTWKYAT